MPIPQEYSFSHYLAAKKCVDDRALNRQVRQSLARALAGAAPRGPLKVLEVGAGIGTMVERLLDWGLLRQAVYTAIDLEPDNLREARHRLGRYAASQGWAIGNGADGRFTLQGPDKSLTLSLEAVDLYDFHAREGSRTAWDLLIAHGVLDLLDLARVLPRLFSFLSPGGLFYFTLNFDGATILLPRIEARLDGLIEALYHQTMDQRRIRGRRSGSSKTGRRLGAYLRSAPGVQVLAAGRSDWLVFPGQSGYPPDEAYFLHFIVHTIHQALKGHPRLPGPALEDWIARRHAQIEQGALTYIAQQWDFLGRVG